ncbi:MAG: CYTH domain-containing protein [Planctomycetales bacterium]|nr:CYTH domain-containing protein [Planctomycetales bacterium]
MGIEIERKFLVHEGAWRDAPAVEYRQGYLSRVVERTVRVRTAGDRGYLTVKGESQGASRAEFEYSIPWHDAQHMLDQLCERPLIEKRRYRCEYAGHVWEVDEFHGENAGLILAEVELTTEDEQISLPEWVAQEVTDDVRYYNAHLVEHPYSRWRD